ncbi:hypothetical protein CK203_015497 [Vitis vinifera]|uniref:Endonuclease/exonuclease/phosphatase domain-containing protein n=1 Tax=Vitis vinifera TaxID=29760 RepID=A0A438J523_VITVI|nr:hypothetical protein CK203_015497 [Vitis vinifera]
MKQYKELFWEELGTIQGLWSDPWCIGGDFNVIKFPSERSREGRMIGTMRRFSKELEARKEAKEDFKKWALMEEISWRQKSRETWLKEGNKNTGFFHKMTNSNRRRNCLKKIKVNGTWLLEFDSIGVEEAARLEEMFSVEEVSSTLSDLNGDKAPSPDGFPLTF